MAVCERYTHLIATLMRLDRELFTEERLAEFIERQAANGLPAPETLRGLRQAIIASAESARAVGWLVVS